MSATPKETNRAQIVLKQTKNSVRNFRQAFQTVRKARGATTVYHAGITIP